MSGKEEGQDHFRDTTSFPAHYQELGLRRDDEEAGSHLVGPVNIPVQPTPTAWITRRNRGKLGPNFRPGGTLL